MRTLIIADVHANYDALCALPDADTILCAGDVVTFGVEPNECIDWLDSQGAVCVRGEEDDAVGHGTPHDLPSHIAHAGVASRAWTRSILTPEHAAWLAALPPEVEVVIDRCRIAVVHAYPGDYNRYLLPTEEELERITRAYPRADVIVTSHTHRQGVWRHRDRLIVNPGSVGQHATPSIVAYAVYERGNVTLGTARYDVTKPIAKVRASALPADVQEVCIRELVRGNVRPKTRLPVLHSIPA